MPWSLKFFLISPEWANVAAFQKNRSYHIDLVGFLSPPWHLPPNQVSHLAALSKPIILKTDSIMPGTMTINPEAYHFSCGCGYLKATPG